METWVWVVIAVAAVLVLIALFFALTRGRERRFERKRARADELRQEAGQRLSQAERREAAARQEAERVEHERAEARSLQEEAEIRQARAEQRDEVARREVEEARQQRTEAEDVARRAQKLDPDAADPGDDFDARDALRRSRRDARPGGIQGAGEEHRVVRAHDERGDEVVSDETSSRQTEPDDDERPGSRRG
jgi:flagellar biosynthesis/type III secretory pathway M-ring protein FliF/YscJ